MTEIGHIQCSKCDGLVFFSEPASIKIWSHPDDDKPLAKVTCPKCGNSTTDRIDFESMVRFRSHGCAILGYSDRFTPFTDEDIENWDIDADIAKLLATAH